MSALDERWARRFNATQRRTWLKEQAVAYLGGKCRCCGYDRCLAALDFHHRDPREKDLEISAAASWDAIEPELRKCILLCSNCHRETHAGLHPRFYDDPRMEDEADAYDLFAASISQ
jgi:hypothetical protein